jgi:hypothetical protein
VDAVVLVNEDRWQDFLDTGARFGFVARMSDALAFASQSRVLLIRHPRSGIDLDISFGALPFEEEAIGRASLVNIQGVKIPLPTPEDLIILKAVAHRPRDFEDIAGLFCRPPQAGFAPHSPVGGRFCRHFGNAGNP